MNILKKRNGVILSMMTLLALNFSFLSGQGDTDWMVEGKYGIFMHYQYRILLDYCTPAMPDASEVSSGGFNEFVNGFEVENFAEQMEEAGAAWVMFCLDDTHFGYTCSPNRVLNKYTGYKPGELCSYRDLPMALAEALEPRGIKLILYWAGLASTDTTGKIKYFGYVGYPDVMHSLKNHLFSTSPEKREISLEILQEWVDRYGEKVAGWWFDGMGRHSGNGWTDSGTPPNMLDLEKVIRSGNPESVIAFNIGGTQNAFLRRSIIADYTAGDVYYEPGNPEGGGLTVFTPEKTPPDGIVLWNAKPFIGNIYYGLGDGLSYDDNTVVGWMKTITEQGGVATLDYPFHPETGLIKDFAMDQLIKIKEELKPCETTSSE